MVKVKTTENSALGLYVAILGAYNELSILGFDKAKELAIKYGFNPNGKSTVGYPTMYGKDYIKGFWFYEYLKEVN